MEIRHFYIIHIYIYIYIYIYIRIFILIFILIYCFILIKIANLQTHNALQCYIQSLHICSLTTLFSPGPVLPAVSHSGVCSSAEGRVWRQDSSHVTIPSVGSIILPRQLFVTHALTLRNTFIFLPLEPRHSRQPCHTFDWLLC